MRTAKQHLKIMVDDDAITNKDHLKTVRQSPYNIILNFKNQYCQKGGIGFVA